MRDPNEETRENRKLRIAEEQKAYYTQVMDKFGRHCVVCFPHDSIFGITVHEIVPRSKRPNDWWEVENGCPLCQEHHDFVHLLSARDGEAWCRERMDRCLRILGRV